MYLHCSDVDIVDINRSVQPSRSGEVDQCIWFVDNDAWHCSFDWFTVGRSADVLHYVLLCFSNSKNFTIITIRIIVI